MKYRINKYWNFRVSLVKISGERYVKSCAQIYSDHLDFFVSKNYEGNKLLIMITVVLKVIVPMIYYRYQGDIFFVNP